MTDPTLPTADNLGAIIERLSAGDRSAALALAALVTAANTEGVAALHEIALAYRAAYVASLRAEGREAEADSGRVSLDEVRAHLATVTLPRLEASGAITRGEEIGRAHV